MTRALELSQVITDLVPFLASHGNHRTANDLLEVAELLKGFDAAIRDCAEYRARWLQAEKDARDHVGAVDEENHRLKRVLETAEKEKAT